MSQSNTWPLPDQAKPDDCWDLSIVIVSWNVRALLARCLEALATPEVRGDISIEIIVVDNASKDGSADAARAFPGVKVIEPGKNLGYGNGNNLGLSLATGNQLMILNPDTIPLPGSLEVLLAALKTLKEAGIVSPRLLNPDGSVQQAAFRFPTLLMALLDLFPLPSWLPGRFRAWLHSSAMNGRYPGEAGATEPFRIDHPLGACMLLRKEPYAQAGGFDPSIHMYAEEIDLAMRYADAGWECWQAPAAKVIHLGGQSTRQVPDRMFVALWRSRLYLYRKHYPGRDLVLLKLILATSQVLEVLTTLLSMLAGRIDRATGRGRIRRAGRVLRVVARS